MVTVKQNLSAEGLMRVAIVSKQGVVAGGVMLTLHSQPAFGGGNLALLFGVLVLWDNELRTQRHHFLVARAEKDRGDRAARMGSPPLRMFDARPVLVVNIF